MLKYLLPIALGGGLVWLISSSSQAQAAPAPAGGSTPPYPPETIYNALPDSLKQMVFQAYQTSDPRMFELVATELDAYGYREQAALLRSKGATLRGYQPVTAPPLPAEPAAVVPVSEPPRPVAAPPSPAPAPPAQPSTAGPGPALMPVEFQQMVDEAIRLGTPNILTSTAYVLERAGYLEIAQELRRRARAAATNVPAPAPKDRPDVALDPNMPPDLSLEIARQMQLQGDPAALEELAKTMRAKGYNNTAAQLEAQAGYIRTAHDAAGVMRQIDREFKSPGIAQVPTNTQQPGSAIPAVYTPPLAAPPGASGGAVPAVYTPVSAQPPSGSAAPPLVVTPPLKAPPTVPPLVVTATPEGPIPVPSVPRPQPAPAEKPRAQVVAEALATSLNQLIEREGSVPKARYKEDQAMVKRFQSEEGVNADGKYGAKTAERLARYVSDVPAPFYWAKKGTAAKDLATYKTNLHTLALEAEQLGNSDRAERLRRSAERASLA